MQDNPKLTQDQLNELMDSVKKCNEIKKQITSFESELEWTESSNPNDYKYIRHLEKIIDELYEKLDSMENSS
tara:strand:+ start:426 stop:641 length:216 start_codon:yes stop_codon:yes gene_type:complete